MAQLSIFMNNTVRYRNYNILKKFNFNTRITLETTKVLLIITISTYLIIDHSFLNQYVFGQNATITTGYVSDTSDSIEQGNVLLDEGRYEEAIQQYDTALESDPDDITALFNKGVALENLGRYDEANE